ncbi:unnamed protein product [Albugo candida]|uniref:CST complex subunit CTC1 n=1 Tax=Albugo candida TaxID=65357 RepID=A0A024FVU7_9STRA|nr:unnamed protein product [Albugo candida]CCI50736.1 unnamed protein product [Albugo candida]|eukprot:CCI11255.1 unnamed protein product [Albugo candida]
MADNVDQIAQHGSFDTHIKNCFIVGRLSGTISNGDLILSDRTSKIAVTLSGAIDTPEEEQLAWAKLSQSCKPTDEVYIIKNFRVRACHYVGFTKPLLKEMSWAYSLLTALKDMVPVNVSVAEQHQTSSNALADRESDVLMFVTSFYPITTTRSLCSRGICDYQLVRGLITHSSENTNTLRFTQVLMPALCVPWLIKTGENYKITKLRKQVDATSDLTAIGHERMHVASLQPSDTRLIDSIRRFHKVMVEEFGYHEERLAKESVAFLSSFIGQFDAPCEQKYDTLYAHSDSTTNLFVSDCELQQYNILSSKKLAKLGISKWLQNLSSTPCKWKKWKHMTGRIYFLLHILPAMFLDSLSVGSPRDLSQFRRKQSSEQEGKDLILLEPALHQTHLRSVVGQIKSIRVSKRLNLRPVMTTDTTEVMLTCDLQDFDSPETVEVHINLTKFGFHGAFRMGLNVIFMNLDTYIARSSYKVHLNWGQHSSIQQLGQSQKVFPTSEVKMKTSHLLQLYRHSHLIDRSWHRWVARVVHINYFVLKRRCRSCHAELLLEKVDNYDWQHQQNPRKSCELQNLYPFREHDQIIRENIIRDITYLHTCVRGLIDDGSAQVEVFAENRTAWNLLRASETQRKYFENIMTHKMSNLGYFFSACVQPDIAPSHQLSLQSNSQDLCGGFRSGYYEKQLSNVIQLCVNHHRTPLIIIGQRFYSKKQQRKVDPNYYDDLSCTSSVSYGEFRVTTTTRPVIRVEAKRVDTLQLKEEIRRLVATSEEFDGSM